MNKNAFFLLLILLTGWGHLTILAQASIAIFSWKLIKNMELKIKGELWHV